MESRRSSRTPRAQAPGTRAPHARMYTYVCYRVPHMRPSHSLIFFLPQMRLHLVSFFLFFPWRYNPRRVEILSERWERMMRRKLFVSEYLRERAYSFVGTTPRILSEYEMAVHWYLMHHVLLSNN